MDFLQIIAKLAPDMLEIMQKRYKILHHLSLMEPIGRRALANSLGMTERVLRSEVDFLKQQGLIDIENIGMKLNEAGRQTLFEVSPFIKEIFGLNELEKKLERLLNLPKVIIVKGDSDQDNLVKKVIGKAAANLFIQIVKSNDIVTLTGGSTVASVAEMFPENTHLSSVLFVPARGGIGENHEYLANTIVSNMAKKTNGNYRLLHVPENLSDSTYQSLIKESYILEALEVIRSASIVIHGIGDAKVMAVKRQVSKEGFEVIKRRKAIGEAFGYYFDENGEIVYKMNTIGIRMDDLPRIPNIIAVSGGKSKAKAILSVLKHHFKQILVTDEGAAIEMINILDSK